MQIWKVFKAKNAFATLLADLNFEKKNNKKQTLYSYWFEGQAWGDFRAKSVFYDSH